MCVCMCIYIYICVCVCVCMYVCVCLYVCMCVCMYYVCMYVCVYVCIFVCLSVRSFVTNTCDDQPHIRGPCDQLILPGVRVSNYVRPRNQNIEAAYARVRQLGHRKRKLRTHIVRRKLYLLVCRNIVSLLVRYGLHHLQSCDY